MVYNTDIVIVFIEILFLRQTINMMLKEVYSRINDSNVDMTVSPKESMSYNVRTTKFNELRYGYITCSMPW